MKTFKQFLEVKDGMFKEPEFRGMLVPKKKPWEVTAERNRRERQQHQHSSDIGGSSSNYREPKFGKLGEAKATKHDLLRAELAARQARARFSVDDPVTYKSLGNRRSFGFVKGFTDDHHVKVQFKGEKKVSVFHPTVLLKGHGFHEELEESYKSVHTWKNDVRAEHGEKAKFEEHKHSDDKYTSHETHAYDESGEHVGQYDHLNHEHHVVPKHEVEAYKAHHAEIIRHYGKEAHEKANIGWGTDDSSISSKVYPHGKRKHTMIVTTHHDPRGFYHEHEKYDDPERHKQAKAYVDKILSGKKK